MRLYLRDTICPPMKPTSKGADFLVIGAGIAGLRAAIELARAGQVPAHDDAHFLKHTLIRGSELHFG